MASAIEAIFAAKNGVGRGDHTSQKLFVPQFFVRFVLRFENRSQHSKHAAVGWDCRTNDETAIFGALQGTEESRLEGKLMSLVLLADSIQSIFSWQSLYVVAALVVIEGLLSVDNALAIAAMASHLDEKKRKIAMTIGYAGAYGFRIVALFLASVIINNHWLMALGAGYLIWLMCDHFAEDESAEAHGEDGHKVPHSFGRTIAMIAFLDLSLSFDNVVAAVAFARDNIYLVYLGVTIGIITLRMVAGYCIKLLEKYPWLEHTAFLLVGFVGLLLTVELNWDMFVKREVVVAGYPLIHEDEGTFTFKNR